MVELGDGPEDGAHIIIIRQHAPVPEHDSYATVSDDDDGVYYYIGERLKLEGETEKTVW